MRRAGTLVAMAVAAALLAPALAAQRLEPVITRVTFVSGTSVYLAAGERDGLRIGQQVELIRGGEIAAVLEVEELSTRRAIARAPEDAPEVRVGDFIRFVPYALAEAPEPEPEEILEREAEDEEEPAPGGEVELPRRAAPAPRERGWWPRWERLGVRGRIGLRYLTVQDKTGLGEDFSQPALDLRLDADRIGGSAFSFRVDVRARRTYRTRFDGDDETDSRTRTYRLAGSWQQPGGGPWRVTVGRQYSPELATVNVFDGVLVQYGRERWRAGVFTGSEPEPEDWGFDTDVMAHGAYLQLLRGTPERIAWELTTGVIGSYADSEVNREWLYVQGVVRTGSLSVFAQQEVDVYRDWRKEAEEDTVSATSTFVSALYRVTDRLDVRAGYDNRRNVRLYRDRITPVTEFDDSFRRGGWAGVSFRPLRRLRVGADLRHSSGGLGGDADALTLRGSLDGLTALGLRVLARATRYENERAEGWLQALSLGAQPGRRWTVEVSAGLRREDAVDPGRFARDRDLHWFGLDVDVLIVRSWYALVALESARGADEDNDQAYLSLTYRF
jgi:hypothetical protein